MTPDEVHRAAALLIAQVQSAELDTLLRAGFAAKDRDLLEASLRDAAYTVLHALARYHETPAASRLIDDARCLVPPDWSSPQLLPRYAADLGFGR